MACEHAMKPAMKNPRILLVEDDAASRFFLATALATLPATVVLADSVAAATELATTEAFDAWLFDANLPDGHGAGLLRSLRAQGIDTPALAHTASRDGEALDALRAAGFVDVLVKPLSAEALRAAVVQVLDGPGGGESRPAAMRTRSALDASAPVWSDGAALAALKGQPAHVAALRELFRAELPAQRHSILAALARQDAASARAELHRLQASCGFVGAAQLAQAVATLHQAPECRDAVERFDLAVAAVLA
jgi:DNA-binding response OmpR family regulator